MTSATTLAFTTAAPQDPLIAATTSTGSGKRELSLAQRMALGSRLAELRELAGYTQLQVARLALGFTVSHAAVSRLERGVFGVVDNVQLDKLAAFYDSNVDALMAEMEGRRDDDAPEDFSSTDSLVVLPGVNRRLYHMRQAAGLTKRQMAEKLGYVGQAVFIISQWERGDTTPHPDTLLDVAIAFQVSAAWLITGRRAKPATPTLSMRMRAMQKLYELSNRELALLAGMDLANGRETIARMSRARKVSPVSVVAVAQALDVPVEWIAPPGDGFTAPQAMNPAPTQLDQLARTSPKAALFVSELADLFTSSVLQDKDIAKLRQRFLHELMTAQKPPRHGRTGGSMRTA